MPAPDLTPQTPGEPLASITPLAGAISDATTGNPSASELNTTNAQAPAPPLYAAKHKGAGRWIAVTNDNASTQVGDFVGDKESIIPEVERLNAGGEPLVLDPQRLNEPAPKTQATTGNHDATTLKQAVLTNDGWLCPEPKAKD